MSGDMRRVFIIQEETRDGTDVFDLGLPDDIELVWEQFYFDTKHGDMDELLEQIPADILTLQEIQGEVGENKVLASMIQQREEWLTDTRAYISQRDAEQANLGLYERRKAGRVLGILEGSQMWEEFVEAAWEVPDGDPTPGEAGQ